MLRRHRLWFGRYVTGWKCFGIVTVYLTAGEGLIFFFLNLNFKVVTNKFSVFFVDLVHRSRWTDDTAPPPCFCIETTAAARIAILAAPLEGKTSPDMSTPPSPPQIEAARHQLDSLYLNGRPLWASPSPPLQPVSVMTSALPPAVRFCFF